MTLNPAVGKEIITRARIILKRSVLVADDRGVIVAGTSSADTGAIVVDALRSCQEGTIVRAEFGGDTISWCPFVYDNRTIGTFGVIEEGVQVTPEALGLLQGLAEVIVHQHFLLDHIQPTDKVRADFLRQILTSHNGDTTEAYRQADILQINLRTPQAAMLIEVHDFEHDMITSKSISIEDRDNLISKHSNRVRDQ